MKKNVGTTDRVVRAIIAIIIAILLWMEIISWTFMIILLIIWAISLVTSITWFCGLYTLVGINTTCKIRK